MSRKARPPKAAQAAAKKALGWRDKHGRSEVRGGTRVGWTRANKLAKGGELTEETVRRMARFARHRKNSTLSPEYKSTPWRDRGYVAWLTWGGTVGVNWAIRKVEQWDREDQQKKKQGYEL